MTEPYHYLESGLDSVWLANGFTLRDDPHYGRLVSFDDIDGLHRAICRSLIERKHRLTESEFRFLRHELGLAEASRISVDAALEDSAVTTRMLFAEEADGWERAA